MVYGLWLNKSATDVSFDMNKLKGFIQLTRPVNTIICALSVFCGGIIGGKPLDYVNEFVAGIRYGEIPLWTARVCFAALSASFILAAGNAFNDVRDLSCDRINAPKRPIPSGTVSTYSATIFAVILASAGIALSIPLGLPGITIALFAVVMLAAYDMKLKSVPLLGNTVVACLGGLAFIYGGIAGGSGLRSLLLAVFATLLHLGRELIKDSCDIQGDSSAGIKTAATKWGAFFTCRLAALVLVILGAATAIPLISGYFGLVYITIIVMGVWPALIYSIIVSLKSPSAINLSTAASVLKIAMPVGVAAVLAGFQGW